MTINHDDLLALLEDGPHHVETLAAWLGAPLAQVEAVLLELHRAGLAKRFGPARGWVLMTYVPLHDAPPVSAPLQQPGPATTITAAEQNASWWLTAAPEGFTSRASAEQARMRGTKEHFQVPLRLLQ